MRFVLIGCLIMSVVACSTSRTVDYTANKSRTKSRTTKNATAVHKSGKGTAHSRDALVAYAESLLGARYKYGGSSPGQGFDCSGFTCYVMRKAAIQLPRTSTDQSRVARRKNIQQAQTGDLIFFGHGKRVTHVGIVVANSRGRIDVIHSTSSRGVVRDNILGSDYWRSRALWAIDFSDLN